MKKAHFIVIRIKIKDEPGITLFLKLLFLIPIPLIFVSIVISLIPKKALKDVPIPKKDLKDILTSKNILIDIKTNDGDKIFIKTI